MFKLLRFAVLSLIFIPLNIVYLMCAPKTKHIPCNQKAFLAKITNSFLILILILITMKLPLSITFSETIIFCISVFLKYANENYLIKYALICKSFQSRSLNICYCQVQNSLIRVKGFY